MKKEVLKQCRLFRKEDIKKTIYTAWIPEDKAIVGKKVTIKDRGNWTVDKVFSSEDAENVVKNSRDHRNHRKATDI